MPDWSYQTLFRPLLFRMPARLARELTLQSMGAISRIPGGSFVIKTLGHVEASPLLRTQASSLTFETPVGLSGTVDLRGTVHKAVSQFGFGFIEIGPVTMEEVRSSEPILLDRESESIVLPDYYENDGLASIADRIGKPKHGLPQMARICPSPEAPPDQAVQELSVMIDRLSAAGAAGFYIDVFAESRSWEEAGRILMQIPGLYRHDLPAPIFLYIPLDCENDRLEQLLDRIEGSSWSGIVIGEAVKTGKAARIGREGKALCLEKLNRIRARDWDGFAVKAAAGVHEPQDAADLLDAGANCVLLHSGFVFSGPGLPKRINDAVVYSKLKDTPAPAALSFWTHWGWMCLLGIGMIIGGILSWIIAATSVLLPYDLKFLGMEAADIKAVNGHLLHFMSHDRITLAGTMISIGILYYMLARHGLKYGAHWARTALLTSGAVGFSSFFLYLGYGYFDPLHAAVSAVLLPMFVLSMRNHKDQPFRKPVNMHNDRYWRMAIWGQLCFVSVGFALAVGGLTIAGVGITHVFVKSDLAFLGLTPDLLNIANDKLIPLIAHDRAGFGGALFCDAVAILITALWGIQQGERWIWRMLLLGGLPGFYGALSVHLDIGYTDFLHLSPVFIAILLYVIGLILLYPYLMRSSQPYKPMGNLVKFEDGNPKREDVYLNQ